MKNVFLFTGNEELMIHSKIEKLVSELSKNNLNVTTYDMEINNLSMAIQDAMMPPFLYSNKVVIIRNPLFLTSKKTEIKHRLEMLEAYIDNPLDTTYLIIDASHLTINEDNELVKKIIKKAEYSETKTLSNVEMRGWLKRKFDAAGKEVDYGVIDVFLERVGWNLITANNEFDKIINYIGLRKSITKIDIEKVVVKELETNIFALTNAIMANDKNKIVNVYYELIQGNNDAVGLLGLVAKTIKNTYTVSRMLENDYKQIDIANALGVSTNRAYYMIRDSHTFKKEIMENMLIKISDLDYRIKTGQIDKQTGLELFLFAI